MEYKDSSEYKRRAQGMPAYAVMATGAAAAHDGLPVHDVLFDFGNVLTVWDPRAALISRYDDATIDRFLDNSVSGFADVVVMGDAGATTEECIDHMRRTHGDAWAKVYEYYAANFEDTIVATVPGSRRLVLDLKQAGFGVWGLSNWASGDFRRAVPQIPTLALLNDYVVSGFIKERKPFPGIYTTAIERFGIDPATAVFVDDKPENIIGANDAGLRGICFGGDMRALRAALADAGVPVPRGTDVVN
ncbi:MAG: HAD-IA family hydrolase [Bifidobacteriaceae bacterium]|nr:HAD-IA family hydrolase [Bifidobacteriaceae bacterium]